MARPVFVHILPEQTPGAGLQDADAVILDILRASTTIVAALDAGADSIIPCQLPEEAFRLRDTLPGDVVLGGERGGVKIPGFDLGNSPAEYSEQRVRGRTVVFTTTNGTRALRLAAGAARTFIGCLNNLSALVFKLAESGRPAHLICAGTEGQVSIEDCLGAGMIARSLMNHGYEPANDGATLTVGACRSIAADPAGLERALREGRGGRNVRAIGLEGDIVFAARVDRSRTVPELTRAGSFRSADGPEN